MLNLTKLEFTTFDIYENNYLSWILGAKIHLEAMNLGETIKEKNSASLQDCAKVMIFICHHLHEGLKVKYFIIKYPFVKWKNLKERYNHQKFTILSQVCYDWLRPRLQDFKSVSEYNSILSKITSAEIILQNYHRRPSVR